LSGVVFLAIRTVKQEEIIEDAEERQPILQTPPAIATTSNDASIEIVTTPVSPSTNLSLRIMGCLVATIAGVFFGSVFIPSTYIQDHPYDHYVNASKNGLHYVYAMYSGIFLSSTCYYIIYLAYKGTRPYLHVQSIFPAIISGIMWGIAQAGFLVANSVLSQAISFPLISIGPGTIAILWSIFYFKEITGRRNYVIIIGGTILRILSAVLIVLSKPMPR
jgi:glucose uptake protein GlcU